MTRSRDLADSADKDISGTLTLDDIVLSNDMTVADNGKVIFGTGSDLEIYHDGNSKIADVGTGKLELHSNGTGVFIQKGATEYMGKFLTDGAVELYHDNTKKFETTSSGVTVTGDLDVTTATNARLTVNDAVGEVGSGNLAFQSQNTAGSALKPMGFRAEKFIFATGNLGIGTTDPIADLSIVDATSGSGMEFQPEVVTGTNRLTNFDRVESAYKKFRLDASETAFFNSGTRAATIDGSGNLMVGKTSLGIGNVGHTLAAAGYTEFTRNGGGALNVGRNTNDGALVQLFKDGSVFGKMGVVSSDNLNIYSTAADHAGLEFATHKIEPLEAGSGCNGTIDIGGASSQFKNMYLSGSIVLSGSGEGIVYGSGAASTLDEYEEGTWTPAVYQAGFGIQITNATYTRIGRQVTVLADVNLTGTGNGNDMIISGLPFTCANQGYASGAGYTQTYPSAQNGNNHHFTPTVGSSGTLVRFFNGSGYYYDGDRFTAGYLNFTITYFV